MDAVVDPTTLGRMVGDDPELHAEMIGEFLEVTERQLIELEGLFATRDAKAYGDLAHRLKSSVRFFGADKLGNLFFALEKAGDSGDWATIEARQGEIRPGFLEVREYYEQKR